MKKSYKEVLFVFFSNLNWTVLPQERQQCSVVTQLFSVLTKEFPAYNSVLLTSDPGIRSSNISKVVRKKWMQV